MDSELQTLEREVAASPEEPAPFLRYLHHHTRVTGMITPQELLKVQELFYSGAWRPGGVNKFGRIELIHVQTDMVFVVLPTGSYIMGDAEGDEDEQPPHPVAIDDVHLIGKYPVTQGQWRKVMGTNPSTFSNEKNTEKDGAAYDWDNHPVETVSWLDCQGFMKKTGLRLPPENGWEYACRAGTTERFHAAANDDPSKGGYTEEHLKLIAVFGRDYDEGHAPVGSMQPNSWGIYDMLGNMWEWCQDEYHDSYVGAPPDCRPWHSSWDKRRREIIGIAVKRKLLTHDEGDELLNPRDEPDFDLLRKADAAILTLLREAKQEEAKKLEPHRGQSSRARNTQVATGQNGGQETTQDRTPESDQGSLLSQPVGSTITTTDSMSDLEHGEDDEGPDFTGALHSAGVNSTEERPARSPVITEDHAEHTSIPGQRETSVSDSGDRCPDFTHGRSGDRSFSTSLTELVTVPQAETLSSLSGYGEDNSNDPLCLSGEVTPGQVTDVSNEEAPAIMTADLSAQDSESGAEAMRPLSGDLDSAREPSGNTDTRNGPSSLTTPTMAMGLTTPDSETTTPDSDSGDNPRPLSGEPAQISHSAGEAVEVTTTPGLGYGEGEQRPDPQVLFPEDFHITTLSIGNLTQTTNLEESTPGLVGDHSDSQQVGSPVQVPGSGSEGFNAMPPLSRGIKERTSLILDQGISTPLTSRPMSVGSQKRPYAGDSTPSSSMTTESVGAAGDSETFHPMETMSDRDSEHGSTNMWMELIRDMERKLLEDMGLPERLILPPPDLFISPHWSTQNRAKGQIGWESNPRAVYTRFSHVARDAHIGLRLWI